MVQALSEVRTTVRRWRRSPIAIAIVITSVALAQCVVAVVVSGASAAFARPVPGASADLVRILGGGPHETWTTRALGFGLDYALGLWRITPRRVYPLLNDSEILGVSGSTGSFLYWAPEYDAVIAGTFNQTGYQRAHVMFLLRLLGILDRVEFGNDVSRRFPR